MDFFTLFLPRIPGYLLISNAFSGHFVFEQEKTLMKWGDFHCFGSDF